MKNETTFAQNKFKLYIKMYEIYFTGLYTAGIHGKEAWRTANSDIPQRFSLNPVHCDKIGGNFKIDQCLNVFIQCS